MKNLVFFLLFFFSVSCVPTKTIYVPTENTHRIEYRDSIVHIVDTLKVEIEKEKIVEVKPIIDTSRLETKIAISEAFVDTVSMKLHHTLKNKPNGLKMAIDTVVIVKTKTEYLEKPVIQEIEVPVKYIPKVFWFTLWFSILGVIFIIIKIYLKFK